MLAPELKILAAAGALGCCTLGSYCIYRNRHKIPHASEYSPIGEAYLCLGLHDHERFNILIEIHEAREVPPGESVVVSVISGRWEKKTQPVKSIQGKCEIHERLSMHVRQCDSQIRITAFQRRTIVNEPLGETSIRVKEDLLDKSFPKRKWFILTKDDKNTTQVQASFHRLDTEHVVLGEVALSPLVEQALLHAQYEAAARGEQLKLDIKGMGEKEKLRFFSNVLEGPLLQLGGVGRMWKSLYFKPVEVEDGKWEWQYWESKQLCQERAKRSGKLSMLGISTVLADRHDRSCFYVRYHSINGSYDLIFKRVDRDRDIWSEGLYEFIERLRSLLEKESTQGSKISTFLNKRVKDSKRQRGREKSYPRAAKTVEMSDVDTKLVYSSDNNLAAMPTNVRRLKLPRRTASLEAQRMSQIISKPSTSIIASRMASGVMYEDDSDDE